MTLAFKLNLFVWVRANPLSLSEAQLSEIRKTRHLTDLDIGPQGYRALIRAGHRYAGEMPYLKEAAVSDLMAVAQLERLKRCLAEVGVTIGSKARQRVWVPTLELLMGAVHP